MQSAPSSRRLVLVGCLIVLGCLFATACSGSGKSQPTPGNTIAAPTPPGTPAAAQQTAVAIGVSSPPLVDFSDPQGRYAIKLPANWDHHDQNNWVVIQLPSQKQLTTFGVFCSPGDTVDGLISADAKVVHSAGVQNVVSSTPVQVAGVTGRRIESTTSLADLILHNITYYVEGRGCAWRIELTSGGRADLAPLAQALVQSFRFTGS
jgi:hypothetical protein